MGRVLRRISTVDTISLSATGSKKAPNAENDPCVGTHVGFQVVTVLLWTLHLVGIHAMYRAWITCRAKTTYGKNCCKLAEPQSSDCIKVKAHQLPSKEAVEEVSQAGEEEDDARHQCSTLFIPEPHCSSQAGMNEKCTSVD